MGNRFSIFYLLILVLFVMNNNCSADFDHNKWYMKAYGLNTGAEALAEDYRAQCLGAWGPPDLPEPAADKGFPVRGKSATNKESRRDRQITSQNASPTIKGASDKRDREKCEDDKKRRSIGRIPSVDISDTSSDTEEFLVFEVD